MEEKQRDVLPSAASPSNGRRSRAERPPAPATLQSFLQWWYAFSAPPEVPENAHFEARERVRRGRVASLLIIGTFLAAVVIVSTILLAIPGVFLLQWTLTGICIGVLCCIIAIPLNHKGNVHGAGILLLIAVDVIVAGIVLSERDGLDPLFLSMFDLLVASELIAVSLLAPTSVFVVALANSLLIVLDINVQPHSMMWSQMIASQGVAYSLLARPIILYVVVAAVSYLWVRSAVTALQRADRAELITELERRELDQKHQLEEGIEQILKTHIQIANGNLEARAPIQQSNVLWRIGLALNNLLARFQYASQAERNLQREAADVTQLRLALRSWYAGQGWRWQIKEDSPLAPLGDDLRNLLTALSSTGRVSLPASTSPSIPNTPSNPGFANPPSNPGFANPPSNPGFPNTSTTFPSPRPTSPLQRSPGYLPNTPIPPSNPGITNPAFPPSRPFPGRKAVPESNPPARDNPRRQENQ